MKKRILLFTAVAAMVTAVLTSGNNGAGAQKGYNCTGSETGLGNTNGCSASGCHGASATTGITVAIELDSAGIPTTHYIGGQPYTVKITGTNTTAATLPYFGFQVSCIKGAIAVITPVNAGTFATTGLPARVRYTAAIPSDFVCNVIEHSNPIVATTGTGAAGTTYVESFTWTAPIAGTGTVSFWAALNAVNHDGGAGGDFWNTTNVAINEWASGTAAVLTVPNTISVKAFPNPVSSSLNLQMDNTQAGTYSLQVFDINGRSITTDNIVVNGTNHTSTINTANWLPGTYQVVVVKDGNRQVIPVVKM